MKLTIYPVLIIALATGSTLAQKGVDSQNKTIQKEATRTTDRGNDVSTSWSFGAGKTKEARLLPNPLRLVSRRDVLAQTILDVLLESRIAVDQNASRASEGFIVTEPHIFAKGAVITRNELGRYAVVSTSGSAWTRGRFTLTIEIKSIDGINNNVEVTAKVEGRSESGLVSEWSTLPSTGVAENDFLKKLLELVTGKTPEEYMAQDR
jgi:hypothetical protein